METIAILLRLGYGTPIFYEDIAKTLTCAWGQIHERLPREDARKSEAGQVEEAIDAEDRMSTTPLSDNKHAADPLRAAYLDSRWRIPRATTAVQWQKGLMERGYRIAIGDTDEASLLERKETCLGLQKAKGWMKKAGEGIGSFKQQSRGYGRISEG